MAPIPCTAPDCTTTFQETLDPQVLLALIQMHDRTAHAAAAAAPNQPSASAEKVRRPTITSSGTSEEFTYFKQRWSIYKLATKLQGRDVLYQLLECTDEPLRRDLTRTYGDLSEKDETTALNLIETLAVRLENHLVARVQLQQLRQDRDEPIRAFCARLRGQASVCRFIKKCPCAQPQDVDYSDEMIRDCLIRNIQDEDIKLDVLGQVNQDISLDDALQLIEAKESGKRSASRLHEGPVVASAAMNSTYRRQQNNQHQRPTTSYNQQQRPNNNYQQTRSNTHSPQERCTHCGQTGHGSTLKERMKKCSAYNKQCRKCGIHHHLQSVCQSRRYSQSSQQDAIQQNDSLDSLMVYNTLCSATTDNLPNSCSSLTLEHHIYENMCKTWTKRISDPQPAISVSVSIHQSDASDLNLPPPTKTSPPVDHSALTDTCCQSCLSGLDLLKKLGLTEQDLYPVRMSMTAANNESINILGALPLRITGVSPSGSSHTTRQIVYFTNNTSKLFISKQACAELRIIP